MNLQKKITEKPKILGVIPARIGSTRIPEKMLKDICGKKLIERTYERSKKAKLLDALIIATDSEKIADVAKSFGAPVIMTPKEIPTGTDRVSKAVELFKDFTPEIVVNIWGDEPLFTHEAIDGVVELLLNDSSLQAGAVLDEIDALSDKINKPSIVKTVTDKDDNILYLSRSPIPNNYSNKLKYYHIIGAMAFRREFLEKYVSMPQTVLELSEGIEQLRILENGYNIKAYKGKFNNIGVNTPDELEEVRMIFEKKTSSL